MRRDERERRMARQFALDYNCTVGDFDTRETLVTRPCEREGMRRFPDGDTVPFLAILSWRGKLVVTADAVLQDWCREKLVPNMSAEWGFDMGGLMSVERKLREHGYRIDRARMYLTPGEDASGDARVTVLTPEEIAALAGDERIDEAFLFDSEIRDAVGVALRDAQGALLAVAGASENGAELWELGVNALVPGHGYATAVIRELARRVTALGKVPYYDTALSHLASLNVALGAGLKPSFCELRAAKCAE